MQPATLTNGRRYVRDSGKAFRVYQHSYGNLEIERIADGASVFLQGDDALDMENDLDVCFDDDTVDVTCGAYEHVLTTPTEA